MKYAACAFFMVGGLTVFAAIAPAQERRPASKNARHASLDLTPESFPRIHTLVRPHENEWRHLKVEWLTDVVAARKKAVAEDKPIVICYTGGAGYNEPLGVC
jgi:hypothetical protein